MKRTLGIGILAAVVALTVAQTSGKSLLGSYSARLNEITALSGTYTVQTIGDEARNFTIALKKPSMARIETPTNLWIADGRTITVFNKGDQTYAKYPQSGEELNKLFAPEELHVWAGFFKTDALKPMGAKAVAEKSVNGKPMPGVEAVYDKGESRVVTYYIDPSEKIVRKAVVLYGRRSNTPESTVIDASAIAVNGPIGVDAFNFTSPESAKEISIEEMNGAKWSTNLEEAKSLANKSSKKIFVDFMASWSKPWKQMDKEVYRTAQFKALSKNFVFLRIDVDEQKTLASNYNIEATPTQMILDKDGNVLSTRVGYTNAAEFYAFVNAG